LLCGLILCVFTARAALPAAIEHLHYNDLAGVLAIGTTLLTGQHIRFSKKILINGYTSFVIQFCSG